MKYNLLFAVFLCVTHFSCTPVNNVRLVKDNIKGTETYMYATTKFANSAIRRKSQKFDIEFIKSNANPEMVDIIITTYLNPNDSELSNELYFLYGAQKIKYEMTNLKITPVNENSLTNENYTTYQTVTKQVPVTKTESKIVNDQVVTETTTEMQSVSEQVPVQNSRQVSSNVNYIVSKNKITITQDALKSLVSLRNFYFRFYNADQDFWSIQFFEYNITNLKNFINKIVQPYNIVVN